jgi:8-oxo-dGTP pyrophosphatase MutT (NUDIX family)
MASTSTHRQRVVAVISLIPTHRDAQRTPEDIAQALSEKLKLGLEEARGVTSAVVGMFDMLGMLHNDAAGVRMLSQLPVYFARSLAWFAAHNVPLIDGWRRDSVPLTSQLPRESLFDHAPHVLSALESRRIRLAIEHGLNAEASRDQSAVVVLIKNPESAEPLYLHQFDARADQYQLIGGRIEPGETLLDAANREVCEEMGPAAISPLRPGADFKLRPLFGANPALVTIETSHTYGALTRYTFYGCIAHWQSVPALGPHDRWISPAEVLASRTHDGKRVGNIRLFERLLAAPEMGSEDGGRQTADGG